MKNKIIITVFTLLISVTGANAEMCTTTTTSTPEGRVPNQAQPFLQYCSNISYTNYYDKNGHVVFSTPQCTSCSGRSYSKFTFENDGNTSTDWTEACDENKPTFTICATPCNSSCVPDENFDYDSNGVESLVDRQCVYANTICKQEKYYQCSAGYYGVAQSDYTGCTQCPQATNYAPYNFGTSVPGSESITDCYLPATSYTDNTGTYTFTSDCHYTN